jgi:hypothetical protein
MIPFHLIFCATPVYALPTTANNDTAGSAFLPFINTTGPIALRTSIRLAVATSIWQGFIISIITIAEQQGMWTFRFRIARYEHWWWMFVSAMLSTSLYFMIFSSLSGTSADSLGVLFLSTATVVAIVRYAIPAWRNRTFIELRWLSWTGPSRTGIPSHSKVFCGDSSDWKYIQKLVRRERITPNPSDQWGWAIKPPNGISHDPTALLQKLDKNAFDHNFATDHQRVYNDGYRGQITQVSLLWGEKEGFHRRVSRAINSMPRSLFNSIPFTYDGFNGTGLCLAMGILGRNKGLRPKELVFDLHDRRKGTNKLAGSEELIIELEATSTWYPRPHKVMRSFYHNVMEQQYSGLGPEFVAVAVELALILLDCPPNATMRWLGQGLEQQSIAVNQHMSKMASDTQLQTLYRASYTSMILSINYFDQDQDHVCRPDLTCFALLWLAEGGSTPEWWGEEWVETKLKAEASSLKGNWQKAASGLLGLCYIPPVLDLTEKKIG